VKYSRDGNASERNYESATIFKGFIINVKEEPTALNLPILEDNK